MSFGTALRGRHFCAVKQSQPVMRSLRAEPLRNFSAPFEDRARATPDRAWALSAARDGCRAESEWAVEPVHARGLLCAAPTARRSQALIPPAAPADR